MTEQEHHFKPSEAEKYGITEAIILYNIRFWLDKNKANGTHLHDGRVWIRKSYNELYKELEYLTVKKIRDAITKLERSGAIISAQYGTHPFDRTKFYTFDDPRYMLK